MYKRWLGVVIAIIVSGFFNVCVTGEPTAITCSSIVLVKGQLDSSYAGKDVTMLLVKKGAETGNVTKADIGYVDMSNIQADGSYKFKFTFNGNTDDYQVKVNQADIDVTLSVTKAVTESQMFQTDIQLDYNTLSISGLVEIDNILGVETDTTYTTIIGFYSKDNKLLGVKASDTKEIGLGITTGTFECDIPEGTYKAKAYVWCNLEKMLPLCAGASAIIRPYMEYIDHGTSIENTYKKLKNEKKLNIVFLGGSVTAGTGSTNSELYSWRARITSWLKQEFPEANITAYNAAIGGSGSRLGAYRLERDVLSKNPDLVFVTYAINDLYCGDTEAEVSVQYETIIRNILAYNPYADIISLYDIDTARAKAADMFYKPANQAKAIADYYNIPTINMGRALADSIDVFDAAVWSQYFADIVHPKDAGYDFYANVVKSFFKEELDALQSVDITQPLAPKVLPQNTSNVTLMTNMHYITAENINIANAAGWSLIQDASSGMYPQKLYSTTSGSEFEFSFQGKEIGVFLTYDDTLAFPLEWSIDGGAYKTRAKITDHPAMLEKTLSDTNHTIKIRMKSNLGVRINAMLYR